MACANAGSSDDGGSDPPDSGPTVDSPPAINCEIEVCVDAYYVDAETGSDENDGTRDDPFATIARGIQAAANTSPPRSVIIGSGTYLEEVTMVDGVSLFGGYDALGGWIRDPSTYVTEIHGGLRAVTAVDISIPTKVEGMTISTDSATEPGTSPIAIMAVRANALTLSDVIVNVGDGAPGIDGTSGSPGDNGGQGGRGQAGCEDSGGFFCSSCSRPNGGIGGSSSCNMTGGRGGRPGRGTGTGETGIAGTGDPTGGSGGNGGPGDGNGTVGSAGSAGTTGEHGIGGERVGMFTEAGYLTANGADGISGTHGAGGGGGGGGGGGNADCDSYGSAGGGGGGGGCGGGGGIGGGGGGGSFGVLMLDANVTLENCQINAGRGGVGGIGGDGAGGGTGGGYGLGGPYGGSGQQDDGGDGARGGNGGSGGGGGHGGGGGGGPSAALVCVGESVPALSGTEMTTLGAGTGGLSAGNAGANGLATMSYDCGLF